MLALEESENAQKKPTQQQPKKSQQLSTQNTLAFSSTPIESFTATNIDDALSLLDIAGSDAIVSGTSGLDRHPERRAKSAFAAFEERESAKLREENKGLRMTQVRQAVAKMWKKSPENPMVN